MCPWCVLGTNGTTMGKPKRMRKLIGCGLFFAHCLPVCQKLHEKKANNTGALPYFLPVCTQRCRLQGWAERCNEIDGRKRKTLDPTPLRWPCACSCTHTHTQHKPEINILVNLDVQIVAFHVVSIRRSLIQLSIAQPSLSFRMERKKKKLYPTNPPSAISQWLLHRVFFFFAQIPFSPCTYPSPGWHVLGIFFIPLKNFAIFVTKKNTYDTTACLRFVLKKSPQIFKLLRAWVRRIVLCPVAERGLCGFDAFIWTDVFGQALTGEMVTGKESS